MTCKVLGTTPYTWQVSWKEENLVWWLREPPLDLGCQGSKPSSTNLITLVPLHNFPMPQFTHSENDNSSTYPTDSCEIRLCLTHLQHTINVTYVSFFIIRVSSMLSSQPGYLCPRQMLMEMAQINLHPISYYIN